MFLSGVLTSRAVQNPSISLDMDPAGNSYSDPGMGGDNSMTVGTIDSDDDDDTDNRIIKSAFEVKPP